MAEQGGFTFGPPPRLRWDEETMKAEGPAGVSAEVWRSAVSGKLVLTVIDGAGVKRFGRLGNPGEAMERADEMLAEADREKRSGRCR